VPGLEAAYKHAAAIREDLEKRSNVTLVHGVDATRLGDPAYPPAQHGQVGVVLAMRRRHAQGSVPFVVQCSDDGFIFIKPSI